MLTANDIANLRAAGNSEEDLRAIILEEQILDEKIQLAAYQEWLGILVDMWSAVDKDVDEKRLMYYAKEFQDVPLGLLERAVKRAVRNNGKYLSVPSVGSIWDALKKETGDNPNIDVLEAVKLWQAKLDEAFDQNIYRFPYVPVRVDAVTVQLAEGV